MEAVWLHAITLAKMLQDAMTGLWRESDQPAINSGSRSAGKVDLVMFAN